MHELRTGMTCVDAFSLPPPQARRGAPAPTARRHPGHRRRPEPGRPQVPDQPALHPHQCRRGPPPVDRHQGLHRRASCPPSRRSTRSSTCWASASPRWPSAAPKKSQADRRHLRATEAGQPRGRSGRRHPADLDRRQGDGQYRPVLTPGQEPHQDQGGGPRLQARGDADALRHLPAASTTTCGCTWPARRSPATSSWIGWSSGGRRSGSGS